MATYYIGPTGDDTTGDGSEGNPWFNLLFAINNSSASDTIIVKEGTYIQTFGNDNIYFSNRIIKSENNNPENTILDFTNVIFERIEANNQCQLSGIQFRNIFGSNTNRPIFRNFNAEFVEKCIFNGCHAGSASGGRSGLFVNSATSLIGCIILNCFNVFNNSAGLIGSNGTASLLDLTNCIIYQNIDQLPTGLFVPSFIVSVFESGTVINIENTIVAAANGSIPDYSQTSGAGIVVNTTFSCLHNVNYSGSETGVITDDPKLVDPDNGFFDLATDSPAIGLGTLS